MGWAVKVALLGLGVLGVIEIAIKAGGVSAGDVGPVAFDGCAGSLHRAHADTFRDAVVVICAPPGRDGRCAYRSLFLWAQDLAAMGFWVLRYDPPGEGDSLHLPPDADQWSHWLAGLRAAVAAARRHTGARRVIVAGLRAGAALAVTGAEAGGIDSLVLLAPITTGEAWVRELRLAAQIKGGAVRADGAIEVDGLRLSAFTIRSLEAVDLRRAEPFPGPIFMAAPAAVAKRLGGLSPQIQVAAFPGYVELFRDPHVNEHPAEVLRQASAWLCASAAKATHPALPMASPVAELSSGDWVERRVAFGPGLRGVLCLPSRRRGRQSVIFGNTAGDPRAGIGGFAARGARALARQGVASLRFDFAGVGESDSTGVWRTHVYETSRVEDFLAAAAVLKREGYEDPVLAGVCTGGYHAVDAVIANVGFRKAFAVNSWLVWRRGENLRSAEHLASIRPDDHPLLGEVTRRLRPIRERLHRTADAGSIGRRLVAWPVDAAARAVRERIARAASRGARIHLLFGDGDVSMRGLDRDFEPRGRWLAKQPGVTLSVTPGLEHALFSDRSQDAAIQELLGVLGLETLSRAEAPAAPAGVDVAARLPGLANGGLGEPASSL